MNTVVEKAQIKGKALQAKGEIKEKVGKVVGSERMQAEGKGDQALGMVVEGAGKVKGAAKKVGEGIKDTAKAVKRKID